MRGRGNAGPRGGARGDVVVLLDVEEDARFVREGTQLLYELPVTVGQATLGDEVEVPTVDATARLRVPPGTQSGQRFRLRGRGMPCGPEGRRGDLVVEVRLMLPKVLDERSKELLREFGEINRNMGRT
jgi:molecular chaperone DnaJ